MLSKVLKTIVTAAGIVVILAGAVQYTHDVFRLGVWRSGGEINSNITMTPDSVVVFARVDGRDFPAPPLPQRGDTLLSIDGDEPKFGNFIVAVNQQPAGTEIELAYYNSEGDTLTTLMKTVEVGQGLFLFIGSLFILRAIVTAGFLLAGFWAFSKQPDSGAVRALALFCFAMASFIVNVFRFGYEHIDVFVIPYIGYLFQASMVLLVFLGAFWLNLQLLFPSPRGFIARMPALAYSIIYLPAFILFVAGRISGNNLLILAGIIAVLLQVLAGFIFLIHRSVRTDDNLEKRQTRLVLWGTGTAIFTFILMMLIMALFRSWILSKSSYIIMGLIVVVFIAFILSPLSFIYAFGRYRLLEVEGRIKRGTRYFIVTVFLLVIFFAALYALSGFLLNRVGEGSRALLPAIALALAAGFTPAHRRLQKYLERRIYPERTRMKIMLRDFLADAMIVSDRDMFWTGLETRLCGVLKVERVFTVLSSGEHGPMVLTGGQETPFMTGGDFLRGISVMGNSPVMVDEVAASRAFKFTGDEAEWLALNGVAVVLPLISHQKMIGFLAIASKTGGDDFESADIEMLQSLGSQVAIAGENLMLLEENLEKQRMEDELSMARKVQEGLLPRTIPETPGLEVAGRSLSCLEVAGDYYDVIRLDGERTVLAIGDVSGKGAGAAMLMSNLQASIRTAVRIGSDLREIIEQINDLIFDNTQAHQFITFFAGVFDRRTSTLSYVNAGHNPPLVVRTGGSVEELVHGGLILGAMAEMKYEQSSVRLEKGDLIFLYTDGLSEAENRAGDMYGDERVRDFVLRNRTLGPDELIAGVDAEVGSFSEGLPARDDLTLLVARAK